MTERPTLVLGASGFIGRWVVRELLQRQRPVVGVVRKGGDDKFRGWATTPEFVFGDLARPGTALDLVTRIGPGVVYNLAGYGVDRSERDERVAAQINAALVAELVDACGETGAGVVHVGSALEYGSAGGVLSEETTPQPTTLYGRTKLAGTEAVIAAGRDRGVRGVTARLFTVFGDGEHVGRLFPSLRDAARSGAVLSLSPGVQRRDFAWAGDVAALLVDLAGARYAPGDVVNVASGRMHSVMDFALECAAQLGLSEQQLEFGRLETRREEMVHDGVSVARLQALVGRTAIGDLRQSIGRALTTPLGD